MRLLSMIVSAILTPVVGDVVCDRICASILIVNQPACILSASGNTGLKIRESNKQPSGKPDGHYVDL